MLQTASLNGCRSFLSKAFAAMVLVLIVQTSVLAADLAKDLNSKIQKTNSRMMSMQIDKAVALFKESTALLEKLKSDDPGHKDFEKLQKKYDKLAGALEKKVAQRARRDINVMMTPVEKALAGADRDKIEQARDKLAAAVDKHRDNLSAVGGESGAALLASAEQVINEADAKLGAVPAQPAAKDTPKQRQSPAKPAAGGGDPKQIYSDIQRKLRGAGRLRTPEIVKVADQLRGLIGQLRAADPNHNKLADLEKKVDKLVVDAYAADVSKGKRQLDRPISRIEMYLERNKEEEREDLQKQRNRLSEVLEEHRAVLVAAGAEGQKLIEQTEATMRKVDERIGAALAGDNVANEWTARLRQYTGNGEKDLRFSIREDADYDRKTQLRVEADKVWAEYQQASFPNGRTSDLQTAEEFFKQATKEADRQLKFVDEQRAKKAAQEKAAGTGTAGRIVFAAAPIDPANPANLTTSFKAPEHIYGLIQMDKSWSSLLGKKTDDGLQVLVPIGMHIDGQDVGFQYIEIKKAEAKDGKLLVLDIAPDAANMTAYKDRGFSYGESRGNRQIGPDLFTYNLSQLKPGKHKVRIRVSSFSDVLAVGDFTIEGEDFKPYAKLHEQIVAQAQSHATMPEAKKTDKALEREMLELLDNAGWENIRKLVIVDKDWWLDRVAGGDSAVKSRHIAAAVAAKVADGKFFWSNCTFHQQRLISGGFGPLELTRTGRKRPIHEKNID